MNRFSEFSASELAVMMCSLGSWVSQLEEKERKEPQALDAQNWHRQAKNALALNNEIYFSALKKIRSSKGA